MAMKTGARRPPPRRHGGGQGHGHGQRVREQQQWQRVAGQGAPLMPRARLAPPAAGARDDGVPSSSGSNGGGGGDSLFDIGPRIDSDFGPLFR